MITAVLGFPERHGRLLGISITQEDEQMQEAYDINFFYRYRPSDRLVH